MSTSQGPEQPTTTRRRLGPKRAARVAMKPLRFSGRKIKSITSRRRGSSSVQPEAVLRIQVISASNLVGKDKGGTSSDPFVAISLPPTRHSTPYVKKSLDPTFPPLESTFDFPINSQHEIGGIELIAWDKDLLRKEYLGESCVAVADWFGQDGGEALLWKDDLPPIVAALTSSRQKEQVTGSISLRIGYLLPASSTLDTASSDVEFIQAFHYQLVSRAINEQNLHSVPATSGIGTIDDASEAGSEVELDDDGFSDDDDEFDSHSEDEAEAQHLSASPLNLGTDPVSSALSGFPFQPFKRAFSFVSASKQPLPSPSVPTTNTEQSSSTYLDHLVATGGKAPAAAPPTTPGPMSGGSKSSTKKLQPGGKNAFTYNTNQKDILGIVLLEIKEAHDLPRLRNMLKTGFDMDPFVVVAFGKKIFRTRVIRHNLNPTWNSRMLFHVKRFEENFIVNMNVLDWDKITGNDFVGTAKLPVQELIADAPKPDSETLLYDSDGKHALREFQIPLATDPNAKWADKHKPTLTILAKYEPYAALRQKFWREYMTVYDADASGGLDWTQLETMLDSLNSTLTDETVRSYWSRFSLDPNADQLSFSQLCQCLESEINRPSTSKKIVRPSLSANEAGSLRDDELPSLDLMRAGEKGGEKEGVVDPSLELEEVGPVAPNGRGEQGVVDPERAEFVSGGEHQGNTVPVVGEGGEIQDEDGMLDEEEDEELEVGEAKERIINVKSCPMCHKGVKRKTEMDIITHLAVCGSSDWQRVNRLLVGGFVTGQQAQRKWMSTIVTKVASGSYRIGSNSANVLVQDRVTGQLQEELMAFYVRLGIRVLYKANRTRMEGARARKLLKSMSVKQGLKFDSPESAAEIPAFIQYFKLDMSEVLEPVESFETFNQFFYRRLRPDARPIANLEDPTTLVSCADCRLMAFDSVSQAQNLWIKGKSFTIENLLGERYGKEAKDFDGCSVGIFRLAPQDYHRFHCPVDGRVGDIELIEGAYYTVNPQAIRTQLDVYGENVRTVLPIDSEDFGRVFLVSVGAMMVGSIRHNVAPGDHVRRGQEFGWFAYGGSTILLLVKKGRLAWDEDLRLNADQSLETLVRMGSQLGKAKSS